MAAKDVGVRMQAIRTQRSLTQVQVGKALGVSPIVIHQYEAGKSRVPLEIVERFSQLYGVKYTYLINGQDEEDPFLPVAAMTPIVQSIIMMLMAWQRESDKPLTPEKLQRLVGILLEEAGTKGSVDIARARQLFDLAA